ncbi:MAG: TonB-dependent receptor [Caulobacter sp.]|nr:TonB-dependent receptor [Caulobacter sp.]
MSESLRLRSLLAASVSVAAMLGAAAPAFAQATVGEVVVTAQRREQALQDVPIAVTALSAEALQSQRIEGGQDLLQQVPNVSFGRGNFGGYNFQIRGIGTALVGSTGDAGVGVHANNVPQISNSLGDAEFFDVQRVEILRGPQGTLYGRNATGGVVNIITSKATDQFGAALTGELGNYNSQRLKGFVNVPLGDTLALRVAGIVLKRDGFFDNTFTGNDNDNRDLYSTRVTLNFTPSDTFDAYLMWQRFDEDDNRNRTGKQLCRHDPGLTSIGGVGTNSVTQNFFSQGCQNGSIYGAANFGAFNTAESLAGYYGTAIAAFTGQPLATGDMNATTVISSDYRSIASSMDPTYQSQGDVYEAFASWQMSDYLTLSAQGSYTEGTYFTRADYNRSIPAGSFNPLFTIPGVATAGVVPDPQVGTSNKLRVQDIQSGNSTQKSLEIRLQSDYDGAWNYSIGGNAIEYESRSDYFVFSNGLNVPAMILFPAPALDLGNPPTRNNALNTYDNRTLYQLDSKSMFGEVYWTVNDEVKITGGFRYNKDQKEATTFSTTLLSTSPQTTSVQNVTFQETTGRLNVDWSPDLSFTDKTLIYGSYSRGYKAGGFNPPGAVGLAGVKTAFDPEFVNAYEIGAKNIMMNGALMLNLTGFFYKYEGYQISKIVNRTSVNENINAEIKGLELESIFEPVRNLRFNVTLGYLDTEITDGSSIDTLNRTQNTPGWNVVKDLTTSNCIAKTADLAIAQSIANAGALSGLPNPSVASGGLISPLFSSYNYYVSCSGLQVLAGAQALGAPLGLSTSNPAAIISDGFAVNLAGKELPNSPKYTVSLGAQYKFELGGDWQLTPRVDYYWQAEQFSRIYNSAHDALDAYSIVNLSLVLDNPVAGWNVQAYVKNLADDDSIQATYLTDDSSGLFTNIQITDPRLYGVSLTKRF